MSLIEAVAAALLVIGSILVIQAIRAADVAEAGPAQPAGRSRSSDAESRLRRAA